MARPSTDVVYQLHIQLAHIIALLHAAWMVHVPVLPKIAVA
jgi:hypothetical protein